LGKHDNGGGKSCPTYSRNNEELGESNKIVVTMKYLLLLFKLDVDIVEVTCGLEPTWTETEEGIIGVYISIMFH
jgi:hypothetical protein